MTAKMTTRKGQSAIEYLMTYGWMLLVVAIVGGAIFATVQGQCAQQASGFTGTSAAVTSLEVTNSELQLEVTNQAGEQINVSQIAVGDSATIDVPAGDGILNVGDSEVFGTTDLSSAEACNDYDVEITFDRGEFEDATASGSISGNMAP